MGQADGGLKPKGTHEKMSSSQPRLQWTDFEPAQLEMQYNPRALDTDVEALAQLRADDNAKGLVWPGRQADIAYGQHRLETLDIYPSAGGNRPAPVQIYIHGGYWRARDKQDFAFIGAALSEAGFMGVVLNYPLCPEVDLDAVVASARTAFQWVHDNIKGYGGDPERITLSGHSAGAHLGAAIIAEDWAARGLPDDPLKGAVLVSGIYDPAPAQHISVNAELNLTPDQIARHNYARQAPVIRCPVHVIVGGGEPEGWIAQSADYADHIRAAGLSVEFKVSGSENHFTLLDHYRDPTSDTFSAILDLAGL